MFLAKENLLAYGEDVASKLKAFVEMLAQMPDRKDILRNEVLQTDYIPIDVLEDIVDELTLGHWSTDEFVWKFTGTKVLASIVFHFRHPITGIWLKRTGSAAVAIKQERISTPEGERVLDYELALPAVMALSTISAMRKIGRRLGRSLNREIVNLSVHSDIAQSTELQQAIDEVNACGTLKELQDSKEGIVRKYEEILKLADLDYLNEVISEKLISWLSE